VIVETDHDNQLREDFWLPRKSKVRCRTVRADGWLGQEEEILLQAWFEDINALGLI
jgi:hypothetical protein